MNKIKGKFKIFSLTLTMFATFLLLFTPFVSAETVSSVVLGRDSISLEWSHSSEPVRLYRGETLVYEGVGTSFIDSPGDGEFSYVVETVTDVTYIGSLSYVNPPTIITEGSSKEIGVRWTEVPNAVEYNLYRDNQLIYSGAMTSYLDNSVVKDVTYTYTVEAYFSSSVKTELSYPVSGKLLPSIRIKVLDRASSHLTLGWDSVEGTTRYELYRNGELVYSGADLVYTDKDLRPLTSYRYHIKAFRS